MFSWLLRIHDCIVVRVVTWLIVAFVISHIVADCCDCCDCCVRRNVADCQRSSFCI